MLPPRLDATGVRPAGAISPAPAAIPVSDARQAAFQRALSGMVGQPMKGEVLSKYDDGSYLVRVAGNSARMQLPGGAQVGAEVPLTLISVTPRPTFQVGTGPQAQTAQLYTENGLPPGDGPDTAPQGRLPSQDTTTLTGRQPGTGNANAAANAASNAATSPGNTANSAAANAAANPAANAAANAAASAAQTRAGVAAQLAAGTGPAGAQGAAQQAAQSAMQAGGQSAAQVRPQSLAAALLGRAPLTPSDQLPDLGRDAPAATLSAAARTIASALATAYSAPGVPATINGKTPLISSGVPDADQLTDSLKNALGESGLFYESHVAEWAEGKRPLQELMREPQNQRAQAQSQASGPQTGESLARAALAGPDLSAAQMINQQLHAHEQQRVQWNGQAWPGQPMQWEVQRDQREGSQQEQADGREQEPVWRSGVRFRLPLLGKISAAVTLVGEQVHIQVQTGEDDSAATLRAWAGQLQQAMEAAGSPLASLTIAAESVPGAAAPAADAGAAVPAVSALPGDSHGE
ncbi:flagellar hook-length control protein FliK [Massilia sp. Root418]|jgi:hypothetical protein|uniref:flagellar hook-length control protein FliK n=1 Tax=Massilia sp. Root418 TaxID=1736532 RepID=UPI0009EB83F4|nr:flagellar hook-length control protein FliK [Massilia sp. Root418]